MGVWNDCANKILIESYMYSINTSPIILNNETREVSWDAPKLENNISVEIKTLCLYELAKELEHEGFEVSSAGEWILYIRKDMWKITLDLDANLPYSDALIKSITNNYRHWKDTVNDPR